MTDLILFIWKASLPGAVLHGALVSQHLRGRPRVMESLEALIYFRISTAHESLAHVRYVSG